MKKILFLCTLSVVFLTVFPFMVMAATCPGGKWEDNITSDGRNLGKCVCYVSTQTYPNCSGSCGDGRVLSAGECVCPQANQYWDGSSCVTSDDDDAGNRNNCSAIVCVPNCDGTNGGMCSTVRKNASWNDSYGKCMCPSGYYSNEAPTEGDDDGDDDDSGGSGSGYIPGNSGGSTIITMPTITSTGTLINPITSESFDALLDNVIDWILNIALVLAPLIIVYGGFLYMTAAGDANKVSQGKNVVLYAVIGFILALLAKSLIGIFKDLVVK